MSELKDFLENIRKCSPKIGELAMRSTHTHNKLNVRIPSSKDVEAMPKKRQEIAPQPDPVTGDVAYEGLTESTYDTEEDLAAQDIVDFSPVYKCLHIYSVLGERDAFEKYYRKQRRQQAMLTLQPPTAMHESVEGYRTFFHGIVGFFVCEDHILNTGNGLVTRGESGLKNQSLSLFLTPIIVQGIWMTSGPPLRPGSCQLSRHTLLTAPSPASC